MQLLKLKPVFKDYIWGGDKLKTEFNKDTDIYPLAESWELSCHKNGLSTLSDNPDITLADYIKNNKSITGKNYKKFDAFPVLLKLIDAKQNLSVQVHPDDRYARKNEGQYGKTEIWYVLSAEEGAKLIYGLSRKVSKKELKKHIENETLTDIVNEVEVKAGDLFLIKPGMLHAIGKGIVLAELQQNSDVTYRVYDYGRKDANGNARELHINKACDVVKYIKPFNLNIETKQTDEYMYEKLIECEYFNFYKIEIKLKYILKMTEKTFFNVLCIDGEAIMTSGEDKQKIKKGDSYFCPAGDYQVLIEGNCKLLLASI